MNKVILHGIISNIVPSHKIGDVEYYKADLSVGNGNSDNLLSIRFKKYSCIYKDGDDIEILANARSYSTRLSSTKSHVELYFFTYFDKPDESCKTGNLAEIDGRICKKDKLYTGNSGKSSIHFILANNLISKSGKKINSYLPCVATGRAAKMIESLNIGDQIRCIGECRSRYYRKKVDNSYCIMVAHEIFVKEVEHGGEISIL